MLLRRLALGFAATFGARASLDVADNLSVAIVTALNLLSLISVVVAQPYVDANEQRLEVMALSFITLNAVYFASLSTASLRESSLIVVGDVLLSVPAIVLLLSIARPVFQRARKLFNQSRKNKKIEL